MRVRVSELNEALERYQSYRRVREEQPAPPEEVAEKARRYTELFSPAAQRLPTAVRTLRAVAMTEAKREPKAAAPAPPPVAVAPASGGPAAAVAMAPAPAVAPMEPPPLLTPDELGREIMLRDNDLRPVRYLQLALLAARSVGKITVRQVVSGDEGDGTGFLVAPGVLLTNWHVLPTADDAAAAFVSFDYEDGLDGRPKATKIFDLRPDALYVSDRQLDYAFVGVAPRTASGEPLSQFGFLRLFEQTGKLDPTQRQAANVIQHPLGQPKKLVVRDNYFEELPKDTLDVARTQNSLYYGSDTLKGSSGSPVCSDEWYVVALHRGGVPKTAVQDGERVVLRRDGTAARDGDSRAAIAYIANEGTRVSRIYESLRKQAASGAADAADAAAAVEKILAVSRNPRLGPVDQPTSPLVLPRLPDAGDGGFEEKLVRRNPEVFANAKGYVPTFLGAKFPVRLPRMTSGLMKEAARPKRSKDVVLRYDHFSVVVHAQRRTALFAAGNVDGKRLWQSSGLRRPDRPAWTLDPRLPDDAQPDDTIFSNALQRGHLYKREDVWGADAAALKRADQHSFVITNATPMIANFNNVEWGDLEDLVTRHLELGEKVSYFAGPIFDVEDRYFNQLKKGVPASERKTGMKVPSSFWKIVAWVEDGQLKAAGFVLHQSDEIKAHGPIEEEIDFGKYKQKPIAEIEQRTDLRFPELVAADTYGDER